MFSFLNVLSLSMMHGPQKYCTPALSLRRSSINFPNVSFNHSSHSVCTGILKSKSNAIQNRFLQYVTYRCRSAVRRSKCGSRPSVSCVCREGGINFLCKFIHSTPWTDNRSPFRLLNAALSATSDRALSIAPLCSPSRRDVPRDPSEQERGRQSPQMALIENLQHSNEGIPPHHVQLDGLTPL